MIKIDPIEMYSNINMTGFSGALGYQGATNTPAEGSLLNHDMSNGVDDKDVSETVNGTIDGDIDTPTQRRPTKAKKRTKRMLKFEQISELENFYFADPEWTAETIGKFVNSDSVFQSNFSLDFTIINPNTILTSTYLEMAAKKLRLPVKKVYKWGYDRKQVSRNLVKVDSQRTNCATPLSGNLRVGEPITFDGTFKEFANADYNSLVEEILELKAQEKNVVKRKYCRRAKNLRSSTDVKTAEKDIHDVESYEKDKDTKIYSTSEANENGLSGFDDLKEDPKPLEEFSMNSLFVNNAAIPHISELPLMENVNKNLDGMQASMFDFFSSNVNDPWCNGAYNAPF